MHNQIPFSSFSKLSFSVPKPEDLLLCGVFKNYNHIMLKIERHLKRFKNCNFFKVTTTNDPVIRRLAKFSQ